jgi:hypothetical protein
MTESLEDALENAQLTARIIIRQLDPERITSIEDLEEKLESCLDEVAAMKMLKD